jgi:hypothetical protein
MALNAVYILGKLNTTTDKLNCLEILLSPTKNLSIHPTNTEMLSQSGYVSFKKEPITHWIPTKDPGNSLFLGLKTLKDLKDIPNKSIISEDQEFKKKRILFGEDQEVEKIVKEIQMKEQKQKEDHDLIIKQQQELAKKKVQELK